MCILKLGHVVPSGVILNKKNCLLLLNHQPFLAKIGLCERHNPVLDSLTPWRSLGQDKHLCVCLHMSCSKLGDVTICLEMAGNKAVIKIVGLE